MNSFSYFKKIYADAQLCIEDFLLLESFQIAYLPGWIPEKEFSAILHARPEIMRFFMTRYPPIDGFIKSIMNKYAPINDKEKLENYCDTIVWTIADLIVYNKFPDLYDKLPFHNWDFAEITRISELDGKIVIDGGAGTGRVALKAAEAAQLVYAVEPVSRLREYIRSKAQEKGLANLYVVDGFQCSIPFPDRFADVIITSHALGWKLQQELEEFERVVKVPGTIIHCPGTAAGSDEKKHEILLKPPWRYDFSEYDEADGRKRKYWKRIP